MPPKKKKGKKSRKIKTTTLINRSAVKRMVKHKGFRSTKGFIVALDEIVERQILSACAISTNKGKKNLTRQNTTPLMAD